MTDEQLIQAPLCLAAAFLDGCGCIRIFNRTLLSTWILTRCHAKEQSEGLEYGVFLFREGGGGHGTGPQTAGGMLEKGKVHLGSCS